MSEVMTVEYLAKRSLKGHAFSYSCLLNFDSCVIQLKTNSGRLLKVLENYYHEFLVKSGRPSMVVVACEGRPFRMDFPLRAKEPDPGKDKIKEEFINLSDGRLVRKRLTGMEFVFNHDWNVAVGSCLRNSNQVVNFINNRYIQWRLNAGCCLLHASAVEISGKGVGLCGFSGAGKSTLSLHLMSRGADFISNDRLMIQKHGRGLKMFGVAKLPRINPGTVLGNPDLAAVIPSRDRKKFSDLPLNELWTLEQKYDVDIEKIYGRRRFKLSADMKALVILNWKRDGQPTRFERVNLSKREDLWPAFIKDAGLFYQPDHPRYFSKFATPKAYLEHLKRCKVYELSGGVDFGQAVERIISVLK